MKKFVCSVCGYVYEGEAAPEVCPICKAPASKFVEQKDEMSWAAEHVVGVASDVPEDIKADLRANFAGECSEVGMYLARQESLTERAIRKSVSTGKRQLTKRLSMQQNLQSSSVKSLLTAPRRTLRCA